MDACCDAPAPAAQKPLELLEREITELAAHIHAATCRWLGLVAEFDRREGWASWGCKSCAHWVAHCCALSSGAAREHVRVARRLEDLPAIRAAFGRGELSYSQVRAISRVATTDLEEELLEIARHSTASQLERILRAYRGVIARELTADDAREGDRYVVCEHDDDGSLLIRARLPADEGALVMAALEAGRDSLRAGAGPQATAAPPEATTGRPEATAARSEAGRPEAALHAGPPGAEPSSQDRDVSAGATAPDADAPASDVDAQASDAAVLPSPSEVQPSNADALVMMADTLLAFGPAERGGGDGYEVVVHVDAGALSGRDTDAAAGACHLEHGEALHPETARRLACDTSVVRILERDGRPLSVGRKTRSVPAALRRALRARDRTCRFPGCWQRRFLHAHHVEHWAHGGATDLANLVHLCGHHHRLVHEGGYTLERGPGGGLIVRRPDGRAVPVVRPSPGGRHDQLVRSNRRRDLELTPETCARRWDGQRLDLPLVVDGLAWADARLAEA